jgi:hypothetical protein
MECKFVVGQRVVCVDASDTRGTGRADLAEGEIYTVRWVGMFDAGLHYLRPNRYTGFGAAPCIRVKEVYRPSDTGLSIHEDISFDARRFRPVKTMEFWLGAKQDLTEKV